MNKLSNSIWFKVLSAFKPLLHPKTQIYSISNNALFSIIIIMNKGTTQTRGQIPHILYYSHPPESEGENANKAIPETQARKCTLSMTTTIMQRANQVFALAREKSDQLITNASDVFENATFVTTLLPLLMAYITPLATFDPRVYHFFTIHKDSFNICSYLLLVSFTEWRSSIVINTRDATSCDCFEFALVDASITSFTGKRWPIVSRS